VNDSHSAIAESQASNSSMEKEAFTYMIGTPKETARRLEQQAQVQKEQLDMIHAQQESINSLKQMLAQLLEDKRKSTDKHSSRKSKGKRKKTERAHLSYTLTKSNLLQIRPNPRRKERTTETREGFILEG